MAFDQARDVFTHVREFHQKLGSFYEELKESNSKERTRTLLDYMSRHERHLDDCLAQFEEQVSDNVLDTYFKFGSESSKIANINEFEIKPEMDADEAIELAIQFDACLIEFCREMTQRSVSEKVREVFENLLEREEREQLELSKQTLDILT